MSERKPNAKVRRRWLVLWRWELTEYPESGYAFSRRRAQRAAERAWREKQ